ncbi:MAG: ParB N-terminal domain-containing protein [Anaerovoracaceae bacterium]
MATKKKEINAMAGLFNSVQAAEEKEENKKKGTKVSKEEKDNTKHILIPFEKLRNFKNHPFKVIRNESYLELLESVKENGQLEDAIVRPSVEDKELHEIISGHRRRVATEEAGLPGLYCDIKDIDDDTAIIMMVDCNLKREKILPSEKAFAYKMKMDAIKRQGKRTDLTLCPEDTKLNDGTLCPQDTKLEDGTLCPQDTKLEDGTLCPEDTKLKDGALDQRTQNSKMNAATKISSEANESQRQIFRYIRLTNLIPILLGYIDDKIISSIKIGAELSYLNEELQEMVAATIAAGGKVDYEKAKELRILSESSKIPNIEDVHQIINQGKVKEETVSIKIPARNVKVKEIFRGMKKEERDRLIEEAIWSINQIRIYGPGEDFETVRDELELITMNGINKYIDKMDKKLVTAKTNRLSETKPE